MEKKDKTDYAAAYRQYCTYGRGCSIKQFCEEEDFNYTKFRRYVDRPYGLRVYLPMMYISHLLQSLRYAKSSDELRNLLPCYCKL